MKNIFVVSVLAIILGFSLNSASGQEASVQLGEKIFNDPALGGSTNPMSCNSCHPGGQGLEEAGVSDLPQTINYCIERPLKGTPIDKESVEMKSLILFIKSLGN